MSLEQDRPRVAFQFDGADWHMAEKESAEDSATGSSEEVQFTKWNIQRGLSRVVQMDMLRFRDFLCISVPTCVAFGQLRE